MILERGVLLNQRYRIVEILGQGGMGSVYRAVDENLGVDVAVKDNLFTTEEYARQFRREAIILANLRHPNLPRVTDHFVVENQGQYLVMDYIDGEDLRQRMDRVGTLPDTEAIVIGSAVCDALDFLHSRNPAIVHRDLKPGNVKITPQGQIYLVDFGLAKVLQGSQVTTTGARAMTPGYSPPEQYGTARTDHRSDIFSLGATLYAALTGAIPEDALSRAMEQAELTPVRKHNPRVSKRLASVVEKSLEVRPDDRYQTAEEFKQALRGALSTTRRRVLEPRVTPPPDLEDRPLPSDGILPARVTPLPGSLDRSPLPMPIHTVDEEPELNRPISRSRRKDRGMGCWLPVVLGALLIGGGLGAVVFNRSLSAMALARFLTPSSPTATTEVPTPASMFPGESTPTTSATPTSLKPIVLPSTASETLSPTLESTATSSPTPTKTPMATAVGGGNGQIAFAYDKTGVPQIYLVNMDGRDLTKLTDLKEGACQPEWSPDGQRLAFISPCSGNHSLYRGSTIYLINGDGSGLTMLMPSTLWGDFDPAWSPDGKKIAFTTIRDGGRPRIYVYNFEDESVKPLSDAEDPYSRDQQPAWSPDGQKIAFITNRRGPQQVWIMDANGQNPVIFSRSVDKVNERPAWSPDGSLILYNQRDKVGGIPRLMAATYPYETFTEFMLNPERVPMEDGRYSPDGLWIVLEAWPEGNHNIYVMSAGGAGRKEVTIEPRSDFDPAWRPAVK